ncbi:uncharacterized protein [Mytilus edulis]|uniref:uncharacterized protein n=1 Tax=Mytilus edulis TaxID=6550 RepID=UPI0039EF678C
MGISLNTACKKANANIWLSGDFNLGHINWEKNLIVPNKPDSALHQQLLNILDDNNLVQVINKKTRNDRTLDLMCMTNPSFVNRIKTLPPIGRSDHDIVFCEINFALPSPKQHPHKVLIYKKANWENIKKDLEIIHDYLKVNKKNMTVDDLWNTFKTKTTDTINKNIPTKEIGKKSKLPWVNRDLKRLIRKKNKLYTKKKHDSSYNKHDSSYNSKYKEIKTKLQKEMRKAYWAYIENMIFDIDIKEPDQQCFNKQPKKLYSYIKSQRNENTGIAPLRSEGTLHTNPSEKANILNKQFQSAFTSEKNIEIPTKEPSSHPIMEKINISREGVYKLIKNINTNKATGPDTIAGKILKENIEITSYILTIIFNKSLETGKVPSDWNHANVTPVFKKGDKHHPGNYRPISLTCISCKLLEHL